MRESGDRAIGSSSKQGCQQSAISFRPMNGFWSNNETACRPTAESRTPKA